MAYIYPLTDETGKDLADGIHAVAEALGGQTKLSFKRLQQIIRAGRIDEYLAIGDEIEVEKETGLSISVHTTGSLSATITEATWNQHVEHLHHGVYEFTYDGYEWNNNELGIGLDLAFYGINVSGTAAEGDVIAVTVATATLVFQYVAKDKDVPRNPNLTHSATFQMKNCYRSFQFDAPEALICAPFQLVAGTTYQVYLYQNSSGTYYLNANLQNKYLNFTPSVSVPAGGQLVVTTGDMRNSTSISALKLSSYANKGDTTALESNIACVEGSSGDGSTSIGSANTTADKAKVNHTDRTLYGSNNWQQSALRLWLNSDKAANAWWSPQGPFDRRPSGYDVAGFMYGIEKDFLDVLQEVQTPAVQNWFDGGQKVTTYDKFFVPSNSQVWFTASDTEGKPWDFYTMFSDLSAAGTGADSNRIKRLNGNATYWWLRTPYGSFASYEYRVNPSGSRDGRDADSSHGVAPACVIA